MLKLYRNYTEIEEQLKLDREKTSFVKDFMSNYITLQRPFQIIGLRQYGKCKFFSHQNTKIGFFLTFR